MIPGETLASRPSTEYHACLDCGNLMVPKVLYSNAGWYIGTCCDRCGPYSRESGYYPTADAAHNALAAGSFSRR